MFASMSGQPSSGLMIWPGFQPGRRHHPDLAGAERQVVVGVVAVDRGPVAGLDDLAGTSSSPAIDSGLDSWPTHSLALLDGDVATGVPDERQGGVPVASREVEPGEVRHVGVGLDERRRRGDHLVDRRRHLDACRLEEVGAVDHDPGAGVVGNAVQAPVVGAGLEQALQQVVAAELLACTP